MHTHRIQETERNTKENAETILGVVVLVVLVACGLANVPLPSRIVSSEEPPIGFGRAKQHVAAIQEVRTREAALEGELKKLAKTLETTRADLASFRQVHDTLISQVSTMTTKLQEIEGRIEETKSQAGKLNEYAVVQEQLKKERDEALDLAQDASDRIRDLTLKLQRAGVYP